MASKPIPARTNARILIVDDLPQMRRLIRAYLEEESEFRICGEAIDGLDAIDKAKTLKPDLIILDASMPRLNGIKAAPKLKELLPCFASRSFWNQSQCRLPYSAQTFETSYKSVAIAHALNIYSMRDQALILNRSGPRDLHSLIIFGTHCAHIVRSDQTRN